MDTQTHDVQPPWIAFPNREPDEVFWKQGNAEPFMLGFFRFWDSLTEDQKVVYLQHWNAPEGWKTYLEPGGVWDELAEIDREDGFV